jgi:hypothetical protein
VFRWWGCEINQPKGTIDGGNSLPLLIRFIVVGVAASGGALPLFPVGIIALRVRFLLRFLIFIRFDKAFKVPVLVRVIVKFFTFFEVKV